MRVVFDESVFEFPYEGYQFPGQHTEERILYITRVHPLVFWWRLVLVTGVFGLLALMARWLGGYLAGVFGLELSAGWWLGLLVVWLLSYCFAIWWVSKTYRRTVFVVTTRRLTQFVFTTPWTHYQLSLSHDEIVDTAATTHSYLQSMFGFGDLFARSSAGAVGDFLVENIAVHKDLHNWLSKLQHRRREGEKLDKVRPFVPNLKGEERKRFLEEYKKRNRK
jgi:hypothetical protein